MGVLTIAAEIGGIISLSILKVRVSDIVEQSWTETNPKTRHIIQQQVGLYPVRCLTNYKILSPAVVSETKVINQIDDVSLFRDFCSNSMFLYLSLSLLLRLQLIVNPFLLFFSHISLDAVVLRVHLSLQEFLIQFMKVATTT